MNDSVVDDDDGRGASTRSVDRALQLLSSALDGSQGNTLSALARSVGLSPSTASRLLATLVSHQLVARGEDGQYTAGIRMKQLAAASLHDDPLYELAGPHLEQLADVTQESASLGTAAGDHEVLYLRQVAARSQLVQAAHWSGRTIPRQGTALGLALDGEVQAQGYALSSRPENEVDAVAVPVFGQRGTVLGALSISAPRYRTELDDLHRFGHLLLAHGAELSESLGADLDLLRQRGFYPRD